METKKHILIESTALFVSLSLAVLLIISYQPLFMEFLMSFQ